MKKSKKILAFALVLALCLSIVPMTALADNGKKEDFKVLSIGDSTSNGYCLSDYGKYSSATWCDKAFHKSGLGFMDYASKYATGSLMADYLTDAMPDKNIVFESLTFEGMRTDELRALLDTSYKGDYFCNPDHVPNYEKMFAGDGHYEGYNATHDVGEATTVYEFFTQEIKDADLIIMDCCTNNFGTYIADRLRGYHGGQLDDTPLDAIDSIAPGFKQTVEYTVDNCFSAFKDILPEGMVKELIETFTYALTDMCINFSVDVDMIYKLNPDVRLVVVGPFNVMRGLIANYSGITIDFGALWGSLINLGNTYITTLDPNRSRFSFANVMDGVDMILKDINEGNFTELYLEDVVSAFGNRDQTVLELVSKAAGLTELELDSIVELIDTGLEKAAKEATQKCLAEGWDSLTAGEQSLMHVFVRFFVNGSGTHPSASGYQQKFEAVKNAYNCKFPASVKTSEVVTTMVSQATIGLINSVKAPVIKIISKLVPSPSLVEHATKGFDLLTKNLTKLKF